MVNIARQQGHGWTAAILGSVALHASIYGALSTIEGPAPVALAREPVMAYIVPPWVLEPEPPPAPVEPVVPEAPVERPSPEPEPEPSPPSEPEPESQPETPEAPPPDVQRRSDTAEGPPAETATEESEARPALTRFEWYAEIPEAIARLREAEEQAPQYHEFGNLDAITANAKTATDWALEPPADDDGDTAAPLEAASWGEDRVWLNDNCYASRPAPGSVLAEVHRFTNPTMNCVRDSPAEPRNDLFIEARPDYLDED